MANPGERQKCMICGKVGSPHASGKCPDCRAVKCRFPGCKTRFKMQRNSTGVCREHSKIQDREGFITRMMNTVEDYREIRNGTREVLV